LRNKLIIILADLTEDTVSKFSSSFGLAKFSKERPENLRYKGNT